MDDLTRGWLAGLLEGEGQFYRRHDLLLGLTDTGEIYRLEVSQDGQAYGYRISCDAVPLFPGFPREWPRR